MQGDSGPSRSCRVDRSGGGKVTRAAAGAAGCLTGTTIGATAQVPSWLQTVHHIISALGGTALPTVTSRDYCIRAD